MLDWIEGHPGTAGWLSAVGGIAAIVAAFLVSDLQHRREVRAAAAEKRLRAVSLATMIMGEVRTFRLDLIKIRNSKDLAKALMLDVPPLLTRYTDQLYILDRAGICLLELVSAISAGKVILASADAADVGKWERADKYLGLTHSIVDDAISELRKLYVSTPRTIVAQE